MTYSTLADRATVGFENLSEIKHRALEYIYEAENRLIRRTDTYQLFYNDLTVRADNNHIVDLPAEFKSVAGLVEWDGVDLKELTEARAVSLNNNDLSWATGQPYWYFIVNRQLYLYPEPTDTTKRLGALLNIAPPETKSAVAEVSTIYVEVDNVSGGEYFYVSSTTTDWCVYLVYDGVGTDPEVTDKTSVEVVVNSSMTDAQMATAIQTALNALSGITVTVSGQTVTITQDNTGNVKNVTNVTTPFLFHTTTRGQSAITSPIINQVYHDILPIYARAQIYKDRGDYQRYQLEMAEWEKELSRAKYEIDFEASPNPMDTINELGDMGRLPGRPVSRNYSFTSTVDTNVRRGTEAFSGVTEVTVTHNWGTYPIVQILDSDGNQFTADIIYLSALAFKVDFGGISKSGTIIYT